MLAYGKAFSEVSESWGWHVLGIMLICRCQEIRYSKEGKREVGYFLVETTTWEDGRKGC